MDSTLLILFASVIIVGVALLAVIVFGRRGPKALNQQAFREEWMRIEQSLRNDPDILQMAIIKADRLLDSALTRLRFSGSTMGERMKSAGAKMGDRETVNAIWAAHKLRNRIAHEPSTKITPAIAKKALGSYKKALRNLGAL